NEDYINLEINNSDKYTYFIFECEYIQEYNQFIVYDILNIEKDDYIKRYEKIPQKLTACAENSIKIHFIRKEVYNCLNNILFTPSPFKSDGWICTLNKKRKTYKIKATTTVDYLYVYPYLYLGDGTKFYYNSMKLEDNK